MRLLALALAVWLGLIVSIVAVSVVAMWVSDRVEERRIRREIDDDLRRLFEGVV